MLELFVHLFLRLNYLFFLMKLMWVCFFSIVGDGCRILNLVCLM